MEQKITENYAKDLGELTFSLLKKCQEKEERLSSQFKITVPEFRCLRSFRGDSLLSVKTLVERIALSGSRLTRILEGLENKGFITRKLDAHDRRSIIVSLTKKGRSLEHDLEERFMEIHHEILKGVPDHMHEPLTTGLRNLLSSLDRWLGES
jgi:DNA-binding MarR family transcriptional regulator